MKIFTKSYPFSVIVLFIIRKMQGFDKHQEVYILNLPFRGLHILPAAEAGGEALSAPGACVLMKVGGRAPALKARLRADSRQAWYVENCGMPGERVLAGAEAIPDDAGYFSIVIARKDREDRFINNPQPK